MSFGSFLNYAAYPNYLVFVDTRVELYPEEIWNDYAIISAAQCGWESLIDHYNIKTLLLNYDMEPQLIEAARQSDHWQEIYQDNVAVIFTRNNP